MRRLKLTVISIMFLLIPLSSGKVYAGPYIDDLTKCLVKSTSEADSIHLIKWIFAALSSHPEVKSMATITDTQRIEIIVDASEVFVRLLTEVCRLETQQALKYEGQNSITESFRAFGSIAMRGLMSHPDVEEFIASLDDYIDAQKMENLFDSVQ